MKTKARVWHVTVRVRVLYTFQIRTPPHFIDSYLVHNVERYKNCVSMLAGRLFLCRRCFRGLRPQPLLPDGGKWSTAPGHLDGTWLSQWRWKATLKSDARVKLDKIHMILHGLKLYNCINQWDWNEDICVCSEKSPDFVTLEDGEAVMYNITVGYSR